MKRFSVILFVLLFCSLLIIKISAQGMTDKMESKSLPLLNQLVMDDLKETGDKVISLAEAMPDKDYSWRPEDGVRSVSEVYVHIASSNYFFFSYLGLPMPDEMKKGSENGGLEKTMTDKKQIVDFLKKSFDDSQKFLAGYTDTDYDTEIQLPFGKFTKAQVLMLAATHPHEHLGQSIAYARTNHITPPWSLPKKK
jgi:uncharacterized damage-inducible protein DinB